MNKEWVDELVSWGDLGKVLYIGAHGLLKRAPKLLNIIKPRSTVVDCIEIYQINADRIVKYFDHVHCGDVRHEFKRCGFNNYDTFVWWHGPEHVLFREGVEILKNIRSKRAWVGCPFGFSSQGTVYGNIYEKHLSGWLPEDFQRIGYSVHEYEKRGKRSLVAWKLR